MKFQFKIQPYQTDAVDAVVQVFSGQPNHGPASYIRDMGKRPEKLPVESDPQIQLPEMARPVQEDDDTTGYKNAEVELTNEQLLQNIHTLQAQNNIKLSPALVKDLGRCSLDIEMETGTGKTYVYTKTIFELNRRYGWSKFIVVVPSVAIREGVKKSFEITEEHFMQSYGKKARFFIYNSKNLNQLDTFSSSSGINVMIINTQAFAASLNEEKNVEGRKGDQAARIIYSTRDEFASRRPIDVIAANRPIVIMDEPQKMGGTVTQTALKKFNPLFSLNYSATHTKQHNLIYVLDALDAFNKRLVKKIEVKGFEIKNLRGTNHYLYLESIMLSSTKPPVARLEYEVSRSGGPKREMHSRESGDNLYAITGMEQYKGYTISEIDPERQLVTFSNGESIAVGEVRGDIAERDMRRIQIRETIVSHFEKEEALFDQGIKTLSLFFLDEVARYRIYGEDGREQLGEYGVMFEQEYQNVLKDYLAMENTPYQKYLRKMCCDVHQVHRGYFSIDKRTGQSVDSTVRRGMEFSDDISAYDLILKNKERLLSFEEPTRFIFSHSALREGWDNPNVFQICTLKHSDSQTAKRQEVGRGLRLCVNQSGNRMDADTCGDLVHEINKLTVVASESYTAFVSGLQEDIKKDLYDRPTKASIEYFTGRTIKVESQPVTISDRQARMIYQYLSRNQYVDYDDNVTQEYRDAAASKALTPLPNELKSMETGIHQLIQAIFDESALKQMAEDGNAPKVRENPLNKENFEKFRPMWERINHKYAYTVKNLDSDTLIREAAAHINQNLSVTELKYIATKGQQQVSMDQHSLERGESFESVSTSTKTLKYAAAGEIPYDLIGKIAEGTGLTRRTAAAILKGIRPDKFYGFKNNPEEFISKVIRLIEEKKSDMVVAGIEYHEIEGVYDDKIFISKKSAQSFKKAFRAKKHIQDYVFTDGFAEKSVERTFAKDLDEAKEVCVYAKLPRTYRIPTPVGNYTPDWAILFHEGSVKYIFFVAETKGSTNDGDIRPIEAAKIGCAKKLFQQISTDKVQYAYVNSYQDVLDAMDSI